MMSSVLHQQVRKVFRVLFYYCHFTIFMFCHKKEIVVCCDCSCLVDRFRIEIFISLIHTQTRQYMEHENWLQIENMKSHQATH